MTAATLCQFHLAVPARWHCGDCVFNLCGRCAPLEPHCSVPLCPSCRKPLTSLGLGNAIKPFWERIPRFFAYPAKRAPLLITLGLSVLGALGMVPILGIGALIAASIMSLRYCYRVLYHTALGHLEPPASTRETEFPGVVWQQFGVFVGLFGGAGLLAGLTQSAVIGIAAMVFVLLMLPAAVMTLAVEERLFSALNPLRLAALAARIGRSYLLLWLMLLLLVLGEGQLIAMTAPKASLPVALFVYHFISIYFSIAMFHMMGYVVYQYHEELGFGAVQDYAESEEAMRTFGQQALAPAPDRAQILITEGKFAEAAAELESRLQQDLEKLKLHDRYHRVLVLQGAAEEKRGADHADFYIGKLMAQAQSEKALEVYRAALAAWPSMTIKDAGDTLRLATHARERQAGKQALTLLARYAQRFPGSPLIPEAQLLAAQLMSEVLSRDAMALQLVEHLRRAHPDHALRPQMDALAASLQRLVARTTPQADSPQAG